MLSIRSGTVKDAPLLQGPGIFLEDLFARPRLRGQSVGRALLARVARMAEKADGIGIMFDVLDWNHGAIEFYRRMGATFLDDWKTVCLKQKLLHHLTSVAPSCLITIPL